MSPEHAQAVEITAIPFERAAAELLLFLRDLDGPRELKLVQCSRMLLDNVSTRETLAAIAAVALVALSEKEK